MEIRHNPLRAALDIREELASEKRRIAFFLGAGTSMAIGIPGIEKLTELISKRLEGEEKKLYEGIKSKIEGKVNVEVILDRIRTIRDLLGTNDSSEYDGIKGATKAKKLDTVICQNIRDIIQETASASSQPHRIFAQWIRALHATRFFPVEIFTTNYDLCVEESMEYLGVPFFDGFIGSVAPFFIPESVDIDEMSRDQGQSKDAVSPPRCWSRIWKLHGSINWYMHKNPITNKDVIVRIAGLPAKELNELVIFPSREKYLESRKLPFIAYQDRLRRFMKCGDALLIILGYSFSDQHLNEIIFQGLRSNPRMAVLALMHGDPDPSAANLLKTNPDVLKYGIEYRNLTIYGPDVACVGGLVGPWEEPNYKDEDKKKWPFWKEKEKSFALGDFNNLTKFFEVAVGFKSSLGVTANSAISEQSS